MKTRYTKRLGRMLNLAGAAAVVLAIGGIYALAFRPLMAQGRSQESRIEQLAMLQAQSGAVHREHRELRERLAAMRRAIASVHQRAPTEALAIEFLSDVRETAESLGLEVTSHLLSPGRTTSTHSQAEVQLRCVGDYATICRFLHTSENLARLAKISSLNLHAAAADGRQSLEVTFVLYYGLKANDTDEKE